MCDVNPIKAEKTKVVEIGVNGKLECIAKFCFLGDIIAAWGGVEDASRAKIRCTWAKFRELAPILTFKGAFLAVKRQVYNACVKRVMVYGSETRATWVEDMQRLERTEKMMVQGMCDVNLKSRIAGVEL